jgi:hypothetical protein
LALIHGIVKLFDRIDGVLVFLVLDEGILGLDVQVLNLATLVEQFSDVFIAHATGQPIHIELSKVFIILLFAVRAATSGSTVPLASVSTPNNLGTS